MQIFINCLWVFCICAFLGWLIQFGVKVCMKHDATNFGFITLPFSCGYGLGGVLSYLVFYGTNNFVMVFFGGLLLLTTLKVLLALAFENFFGFKWVDCSNKKLNLNGYVTAGEAFFFGVAALVLVFLVFPLIDLLTIQMAHWLALLIASVITGVIVADFIVSAMSVFRLRNHLKQMKNITELLGDSKSAASEAELQLKYEEKLMKDKAFRKRLIRTFPDMEFADYQKQFDDLKIKYKLMKERNSDVYEYRIKNEDEKPFAYGLTFTKIFWLFFVGSFFGTIVETIWCIITRGHFEIRTGLVWGPFIPVYGGGAVLITLCLYKLHKANDFIVYGVSAIVGATFEYFCSLFQEYFLGTVSWDYSNTPFNIDGRTNLKFALMWGVLGLLWVRYIYPCFCRIIQKIPKKAGKTLTIILLVFMIINGIVSFCAVYRKTQRQNNIPAQNFVAEVFDEYFNDEYMNNIYPNMMQVDK